MTSPHPTPDPSSDNAEALARVGAVFDHAAVAAPRIRDLLPIYADVLGGRFLTGGDNVRVGYRALQVAYPDGSKIELMEPLGDSTFFDSFFRRGGGLHHVTFKVDDLPRAADLLEERGFLITGRYLDDPTWQEVFLHPRSTAGVLVQLAHSDQPLPDPAPGTTIGKILAGQGAQGTGVASP